MKYDLPLQQSSFRFYYFRLYLLKGDKKIHFEPLVVKLRHSLLIYTFQILIIYFGSFGIIFLHYTPS